MSIQYWEILLVDDDESLHDVVNKEIDGLTLFHKDVKVIHAHNAVEAKQLIKENSDISIAFIDISMETPDSGLQLVNYIRNNLHNTQMRIIIIDSNDSPIPANEILEHYDINDYKDRICIDSQRLFSTVRTAIKQYQQFKDIQDKRDEIYAKMTTNEVTRLPNRMKLTEDLGTIGKKSLILINIDDFSVINNHNGFEFGDNVLKAFAKFLYARYARYARIYHLEADIFAMLCLKENASSVEKQIAKIKEDIYKNLFIVNNVQIHLTATIGIVLDDYGNIIQKAEFALKEARLYGKNNIKKYSDDLNILRTIHANSLWTGRIRDALEQGNILAYFQPIKDLQNNTIKKYETLVRIQFEDTIYSPVHFLNAARYSGQLFEIFKLMFEEACKKINSSDMDFSVNVSDYDLKHPQFLNFIKKALSTYKIDPARITFEILENNSISKHKEIQNTLQILHADGFKLAIDDFGAECSNFAQLNNLYIDFIKIDGAFIKNIVEDENSQIIAKTIMDFAHQKNIPVIAEFVSSKEIYHYVKEMGVDYVQGYEIAEPKPQL
jgi:diguanylate cyclase (GGDEF)-like protein